MPASYHVYNYSFVYVRECLCIMFTSVYVKLPQLFGGGEKRRINKHYLFISCIALFLNHVTRKAHGGRGGTENGRVGRWQGRGQSSMCAGFWMDSVSAGCTCCYLLAMLRARDEFIIFCRL